MRHEGVSQRDLILLVVVVVIATLIVIWLLRRRQDSLDEFHREPRSAHPTRASKEPSETLPTFLRHDNRIVVTAPRVRAEDRIALPENFDSRTVWPGWITPVMDQGACGSCWSFSSSGVFGDRIKIASKGADMPSSDTISQYHLAACMKCTNTVNTVCKSVCSGHYMDEVLDYLKKKGAYSTGDINAYTNNGSQYICFKPSAGQKAHLYKASNAYRVNPYSVTEISNDSSKRAANEYAIMFDIFTHGPVTATIQVFDPLSPADLHKNLYLYEEGVYGANWGSKDPKETDGYHAISIIGWGIENTASGGSAPYWLIRNSWGPEWGQNGYGKILRGQNRAIIESDLWAMNY